jgi:polyhydroxyalkanoate synthesis regulator phasin
MRKKAVVVAAAVLVFTLLSVGAYAGNTRDPGIRERIEEQQKRIDQGIASGQLTRREADIVQDNLNRIRAAEARMKADGTLAPRERARLEHMLDRNSKMISKEKHNPVRRID